MSERRIQPHNAEAERAVLGAILLRPDVLDEVELRPADFFDLRAQAIFAAMRALAEQRKAVDPLTLAAELERTGHLAAVGGSSAISDMLDGVPTADNIGHYAAIVADCALKRRVIAAASEIVARAFSESVEGDEVLGEFLTAASSVETPTRDTTVDMRDAARTHFEALERSFAAKQRGEVTSLKLRTGIKTIDVLLRGGLPIGNVTILAGRPSQGKSALARSMASSINELGEGVHAFSTEDTLQAYVYRQFADEADVDLAKLWDLDLNRLEWQAVSAAANSAYQRRGWKLDEARGISIADIALRVRRHKRANRTKLVVIDYAQIIRAPGDKPHERIAAVSKGAADLARQEGVAVLLLSQLNRENEKREDARPRLADLRGAGELEQDAEVVLMVHRPEYYLEKLDQESERVRAQLDIWRGLGEVLCEKAKNGPTGRTSLAWDAKSATYRDRSGRHYTEAA